MKTFFLIVTLFLGLSSLAQYKLTGKVFNQENEPLPGVTIVVQGTTFGTVTGAEGSFVLHLPQKSCSLKASYVGYSDYQKSVDLSTDQHLEIYLTQAQILTEEVFVYATRAGSKTPVTVTQVNQEQIAERNLGQDVPYLLNSTPSFVSSSDAGTGVGYTAFRIRGTDANRINITLNGIPVNDAESHGVWWVNMPDLSSSVENIQVQRGVGTSTHGAGAFGASINMQGSSLDREAYAEYSGAGGSFNTIKNTIKIGTGLLGNHFSIDARMSKINSDGFIDRAWSRLRSYYVSGGYYSDQTIIKLNILSGKETTYQAWNGVPSVRLNNDLEGMKLYGEHELISQKETDEMIASNSRTYNLYTYENETDNYQQDHYQFLLSHQFSKRLNLSLAGHYTRGLGYYEQEKTDEKLSKYGLSPIVLGDTAIKRTDLIRQKWLDNHFYGATFSLSYVGLQSELTLGGGWNQYNGNHYGKLIWMRMAGNLDKGHEWYRNLGEKMDLNFYAKYNYTLNPWLNAYADLQYRGIDYTIDGFDDNLRNLIQQHRFNFFNPKLGLLAEPHADQKIYLTWAVAHREPTRSNYTDADPNRKQPVAERLNDFEAGYSLQQKNYSFGANLYLMNYTNQLILTGMINDVGDPIMTNVEKSYRTGIELTSAIKIFSKLKWEGSLTLSRNKIENFTEFVDNWDTWAQDSFALGETDIAFSPAIIFNSQLRCDPIKGLSFILLTHYVGDQYIDNSMSPDRKLNDYLVNNLKIGYCIHPKWIKEIEFNLLINNLLNTEYESNAWVYSYLYEGKRYKMDGYFPQAGINFLFGVNLKF